MLKKQSKCLFLLLASLLILPLVFLNGCGKKDDSSETEKPSDSSTLAPTATTNAFVVDTSGTTEQNITTNATSAFATMKTMPSSSFSAVEAYDDAKEDRYAAYLAANPSLDVAKAVAQVNIGLDKPFYTDTKPAPNQDNKYILVNKYFYLSENYVPGDLKTIPSKYTTKTVKLVAEAADAFVELCEGAKAEGYSLLGMSGYRSFDYQDYLYNYYLENDTKENVDTYSARPGYSEHQTGYAIDVCTDKSSYSDFCKTQSYTWAIDNIHKYGFVIHYTEDNKKVTGYMAEAWHFRYIGKEDAAKIFQSGLSVDEYIALYYMSEE